MTKGNAHSPPTRTVVVKPLRFVLIAWATLAGAHVVVWADYLVFRDQPGQVGALLRGLQLPAVGLELVSLVILAAVLAAFKSTITVDDNGITRTATRTRHWAWQDFERAEVRRGQGVLLYRPTTRRRAAKVRLGKVAGRAGIDRLATAVGAYLPVTRCSPRWAWRVAIAGVALVTIAILDFGLWEAPLGTRLTLTPATALRTEDRVTLRPQLHGPHRSPGTILSLSVRVAPATFYDAALSHRDPAVELVPRSVVYHHMTADQSDAEDVKTNALSKAAATYLVLGRLGYPVAIAGGEPVVAYSPPGSPLHQGDRVIAVNGGPTPYIENLYSRLEAIDADLQGRPAGHQVDVVVSRPGGGGSTHVTVTLGPPRSVPTLPSLDHAEFISDPLKLGPGAYTVSIDTAGEGGSSAGLALTLGLLDALGPTPILRGGRVAVTGTVAPDGTVGPIGGLRQKVALAERSHATMLMVPCDQAKTAKSLASDRLPVVGVHTLDDALATLAGGQPSCPTT